MTIDPNPPARAFAALGPRAGEDRHEWAERITNALDATSLFEEVPYADLSDAAYAAIDEVTCERHYAEGA